MKIYIGYKFSNIENKQVLREEVQEVAHILEHKGHETFLLGRDLQKWKDYTHPIKHKMKTILGELKKADMVFAFVNSSVFSRGLLFELFFAKLFGKKIILAVKESLEPSWEDKFATETYKYNNLSDLEKININ